MLLLTVTINTGSMGTHPVTQSKNFKALLIINTFTEVKQKCSCSRIQQTFNLSALWF
ncbi:hypothetical protein JZ751_007876 [Albula glossodonta]|uniref:Uncharacterized protein n=1 Tax=Albula glossodonta TaxID=121402 RepID=A0A8T2P149_9TELE|nr:hypothetical protein JZ751_007876 [Albula glossodonta]